MYDFLLPHERKAIQAHQAKLKEQGTIVSNPKFQYGQRVFAANLDSGVLIIKGFRLLTKPVKKDGKIVYTSPSGGIPVWEYQCYRETHQEIGWIEEDKLSTTDNN